MPSSPKDLTLKMVTFQGKLRKQHVVPSFLSAGQSQEGLGAWGTPLVPRNKAITPNVHSVVKLFFLRLQSQDGKQQLAALPSGGARTCRVDLGSSLEISRL